MVTDPEIPDEQLALRSSQGDRDAFAELYGRYFQGLYDLTLRMVREPEMAADLVQNSFIRAWESLQKRTVSGNIKAWLYAIARNTAINEIRRRKRWGAVLVSERDREESRPFEGIDTSRLSNPETAVEAQELVDLVWASAAALGPKDYSLLDLHLRRDLGPSEIATGLGLSNARVHTMLSRARSSLEESVSIALLIRRGRRDCPRLNEILYRRESEALSRDIKLEVRRHLQECEQCAASRRRFVSPAEIFSAVALVPVSHETAAGIWAKISPLLVTGAGASVGAVTLAGRAARWWSQADAGLKVATVGVLGAVIALPVAVSILVMSTGGSAGPGEAAGGRETRGVSVVGPSRTRPSSGTQAPGESSSPTPTPLVAGVVASPDPTASGGPTPTPPHGATPTAAPTPGPTVGGTPTPQPTPGPTALPADQADVAVTSAEVSVPPWSPPPGSGQRFYLSVSARLWNNGGAPSVDVEATFAITDAAGCISDPPKTTLSDELEVVTDRLIELSFAVICPTPGEYYFTATASVAVAGQAIIDPNPANNSNSGSLLVAVTPPPQ